MQKVLIDAQTVDTTSAGYPVETMINLVAQLIRANHSSGNTVFSFDGSNDGINWATGIAILNATQTATTTSVTSVTLSSATTSAVYIPSGWKMIRAVADVTTDGANTVILNGTKQTV